MNLSKKISAFCRCFADVCRCFLSQKKSKKPRHSLFYSQLCLFVMNLSKKNIGVLPMFCRCFMSKKTASQLVLPMLPMFFLQVESLCKKKKQRSKGQKTKVERLKVAKNIGIIGGVYSNSKYKTCPDAIFSFLSSKFLPMFCR